MLSAFFAPLSRTTRRNNWSIIRHRLLLLFVLDFSDIAQPGISACNMQRRNFMTGALSAIASAIGQTLASQLDSHVTKGFVLNNDFGPLLKGADRYEYIMRNYRSIFIAIPCQQAIKKLASSIGKATKYLFLDSPKVVSSGSYNEDSFVTS
jgi:hypothetical protein